MVGIAEQLGPAISRRLLRFRGCALLVLQLWLVLWLAPARGFEVGEAKICFGGLVAGITGVCHRRSRAITK